MLVDTICTEVSTGLENLNALVPLPGLGLVVSGLKLLAKKASDSRGDEEEESARLIAYCSAMGSALSKYSTVEPDENCLTLLEGAAKALEELCAVQESRNSESEPFKLLTSRSFVARAKKAKEHVNDAIRAVMDLAELRMMSEASETNKKVEQLIKRRSGVPDRVL